MKKKAFKAALPHTLPICVGFLFLGMSYGFMMRSKDNNSEYYHHCLRGSGNHGHPFSAIPYFSRRQLQKTEGTMYLILFSGRKGTAGKQCAICLSKDREECNYEGTEADLMGCQKPLRFCLSYFCISGKRIHCLVLAVERFCICCWCRGCFRPCLKKYSRKL